MIKISKILKQISKHRRIKILCKTPKLINLALKLLLKGILKNIKNNFFNPI